MRRKTRLPRTLLVGAIACGTLAVGMTGVASADRMYVCVSTGGVERVNTGEDLGVTECSSSDGRGNVAIARADATSSASATAGVLATDDRNRATAVATNDSDDVTRAIARFGDGNTATATADNGSGVTVALASLGDGNTATATADNGSDFTTAEARLGDGNTATATADNGSDVRAVAGGDSQVPLDDQEACAVNGEQNTNTGC